MIEEMTIHPVAVIGWVGLVVGVAAMAIWGWWPADGSPFFAWGGLAFALAGVFAVLCKK